MSDERPEESTPSTMPDEFDPLEPRAKWPTVVGWLSIVFGSISLTCGGLGTLVAVFFMPAIMSMSTQSTGGDPPPTMVWSPLVIGLMLLALLWQVPLIIAGIATVLRKAPGRPLHLMYAIGFAITTIPNSFIYHQAQKTYSESQKVAQWKAENPNSPVAAGIGAEPNIFMSMAGTALSLAWPTFCLFWFIPPGRSERALRHDEEEALV